MSWVLGLLPSKGERYGAIPMPTPMTWKLPSLCVLLNLYLRIAAPQSATSEISSIQVLRNFISRPHVDGNNKGKSWGLAFGNYVGGGVWSLCENGDCLHTLQDDVKGPRGNILYRGGRKYLGRVLDTRRNPQEFDGNQLHFTMPLSSGTRIAIVYYCQKVMNARTPGAMHEYLSSLGFKLPEECCLRPTGQEVGFVNLALQGIAVKDEPHREPLPTTREVCQRKDFQVKVEIEPPHGAQKEEAQYKHLLAIRDDKLTQTFGDQSVVYNLFDSLFGVLGIRRYSVASGSNFSAKP